MVFDLIKKRRSVFPPQYTDKPIEREVLQQLLEAANWAPTHKKTEPWRFKVFTGKARNDLGDFLSNKYQEVDPMPKTTKSKKLRENPRRSGAVIAICMQRDPMERIPEWEEVAAVSMAVQNIWLGCTEMGIGCYWSSPGIITYMHEFLDLAEGERCLGFLYMGYMEGDLPEQDRGPIADKVEWLG
ncbi:MAG: nitroreductase [Flavobacteriaceae bacterium]